MPAVNFLGEYSKKHRLFKTSKLTKKRDFDGHGLVDDGHGLVDDGHGLVEGNTIAENLQILSRRFVDQIHLTHTVDPHLEFSKKPFLQFFPKSSQITCFEKKNH